MSETLSPAPAAVTAAATTETFSQGGGSFVQAPETFSIQSPLDFSPSISPTFGGSYENGDLTSVFAGEPIFTAPEAKISTPEIGSLPTIGETIDVAGGSVELQGTLFPDGDHIASPLSFLKKEVETFDSPYGFLPETGEKSRKSLSQEKLSEQSSFPSSDEMLKGVEELLTDHYNRISKPSAPVYDEEGEIIAAGKLPTKEEAVSAVEQLLEISFADYELSAPSTSGIQGIEEAALPTPVESVQLNEKEALPITKQYAKPLPSGEKNDKETRTSFFIKTPEFITEVTAEKFGNNDFEALTEKNPEITPQQVKAAYVVTAEAEHAVETVHALKEAGVANAEELVAQSLTEKLEKEGVEAEVAIAPQDTSAPEAQEETASALTVKLKLKEEDAAVPEPTFVVDESAQQARKEGFDTSVEKTFALHGKEGNKTASGKDVLGEFTEKEEQKSEPLRGSPQNDGSLGEVTQTIYEFPKTGDEEQLRQNIQDVLAQKPPVRVDTTGRPVTVEDVERVFHRTKVLDASSIEISVTKIANKSSEPPPAR